MSERIKLNYDDITIVPDKLTDICSRSQCNPYDEDGYLPIFASCMSSVVSIENAGDFNAARIRAVIPRSYSVDERLEYLFKNEGNFVAFSLNEARDIFINRTEEFEIELRLVKRFTNKYLEGRVANTPIRVCIDLANGHMKCLLDLVKELKAKYGDSMLIMTGNIANPKTYADYEKAGVDYCRVSIGTGCFTGDMLVETSNGLRPIKDIKIGDRVKTHTGDYEEVTDTMSFYRNEKLYDIDGIKCTGNHEFYAIKQEDIDKVTEDNVDEYAFWVRADELDKSKHYLIQM